MILISKIDFATKFGNDFSMKMRSR